MKQRTSNKEKVKIEEGYKVVYEVAENIPLEEWERRVQAAFNMLFEIIDREYIGKESPTNPQDHFADKQI